MDRKNFKKFISFVLIIAMLVGTPGLFVSADDDAEVDNNSRLVFSGVELIRKDGDVQAFVDFSLRNVTSNGVHFALEYDPEYVELSNAADNGALPISLMPYSSSTGTPIAINTAVFPKEFDLVTRTGDYIITAQSRTPETGSTKQILYVDFGLLPNATRGEYVVEVDQRNSNIGEDSDYASAIRANSTTGDVKIGRISFKVKKPAEFVKLDEEGLRSVFHVLSTGVTTSSNFGVQYLDNANINAAWTEFYDSLKNLAYEFEVQNMISEVKITDASREVYADELYGLSGDSTKGTVADLLAYFNTYMTDATIVMLNGTEMPTNITWGTGADGNKAEITHDGVTKAYDEWDWDPKGSDEAYMLTQAYNDDATNPVSISATLKVVPVHVVDYKIIGEEGDENGLDSRGDILNHLEKAVPIDREFVSLDSTIAEYKEVAFIQLNMFFPKRVELVFSKPVSKQYILYTASASVDSRDEYNHWKQVDPTPGGNPNYTYYNYPTVPTDYSGVYTFEGEVITTGEKGLEAIAPWATPKSGSNTIEVYRSFDGARAEGPSSTDISASVDDSGVLTVVINTTPETPAEGETAEPTDIQKEIAKARAVYNAAMLAAASETDEDVRAADEAKALRAYHEALAKIYTLRMPVGESFDPEANFGSYTITTSDNAVPGTSELSKDTSIGGSYSVTIDDDPQSDSYGRFTIVVNPAGKDENSQQERASKYINLGNKLGNFAVRARIDKMGVSEWTEFTINPVRTNYYLLEGKDKYSVDKDTYFFDYTGNKAELFVLAQGIQESLPTTVRLPGDDGVYTTFDGGDGSEPGKLNTVSISGDWEVKWYDSDASAWKPISDVEGGMKALALGTQVEFFGTLKNGANYAGYGEVAQPSALVYIKIRGQMSEATEDVIDDIEDLVEIDDIDTFIFRTQQVGYGPELVENHSFKIKNIGQGAITGLYANISIASDETTDYTYAFDLTKVPAYLLEKDGETTFDISTVHGLPRLEGGKSYTATVTIGSTQKVLKTFKISFLVTAGVTFKVEVEVLADDNSGRVVLPGGSTYTAYDAEGMATGRIVFRTYPEDDFVFDRFEIVNTDLATLLATQDMADAVNDVSDTDEFTTGYAFKKDGSVVESDTGYSVYSFPMPDLEKIATEAGGPVIEKDEDGIYILKLKAYFKEDPDQKGATKLRLETLEVSESGKETVYGFVDGLTYLSKAFDPKDRDYAVILPADSSAVKFEGAFYDGNNENVSVRVTLTHIEGDDELSTYQWNPAVATNGVWSIASIDTEDIGGSEASDHILPAPKRNIFEIVLRNTADNIERKYTVEVIKKKSTSEMVQFYFGNTPAGLIRRMQYTDFNNWGEYSGAGVDGTGGGRIWEALRLFFGSDKYPLETETSVGQEAMRSFASGDPLDKDGARTNAYWRPTYAVENLYYSEEAWYTDGTLVDYDEDPTALVVYNGEAFTDPGFLTLTNSIGENMNNASEIDTYISRKIINVVEFNERTEKYKENAGTDSLNTQFFSKISAGKEYDISTTPMASDITVFSDENDEGKLRIRPGVYAIEYTFRDYDQSVVSFTRPLIVLAKRGDVDISGEAGNVDAAYIMQRGLSAMPYRENISSYLNRNLYRFRVVDANADRDVNIADYNFIRRTAEANDYKEFYPAVNSLSTIDTSGGE